MNICEIIFYDLYNENAENWKDSAAFCVMFKNFPMIYSHTSSLFENIMQNEDDFILSSFHNGATYSLYKVLNYQIITSFCQTIFLKEVIFIKHMWAFCFPLYHASVYNGYMY